MQTALDPKFPGAVPSALGPSISSDADYRVKIYKEASRSAHEEVERAAAAFSERSAVDRERARLRRESEIRDRSGR